jgi:hypothetical protein
MNNTKEIDIYICFPGEKYSYQTMAAWEHTVRYLLSNNITYMYSFIYTPLTQHTRNHLVSADPDNLYVSGSIPLNGKYRPKKIIMIDDDIVWTVEDFKKIIESDKDIIGGFYWSENEKSVVAELIDNKGKKINAYELDLYNSPIELNQIGFGFVAIKFEVFEKMSFPWFETYYRLDNETKKYIVVGEDVHFCVRAREMGYKTYGDPSIKLGHIKDFKHTIPTNK